MAENTHIKTITRSLSEAFDEMQDSIKNFEQEYGCTSEQMLRSVRSGEIYDTPEIATWLTHYHVLRRLEAQYGATTGIPMKDTEPSMSDT